jgi:hypothetical protein
MSLRYRLLGTFLSSSLGILILVVLGLPSAGLRGYKLGELDFAYLYVAGYSWRTGHNPYDVKDYHQVANVAIPAEVGRIGPSLIECSYAYAPTSAAMVTVLAALRFDTARLTFLGINLVALAVVATSLVRIALDE